VEETDMSLRLFGAGVGRTGTYSLKLALNQLGFGATHHMEEVLLNMPVQLPLWQAAVAGSPDWKAIYTGYSAAVDWPTAGFWRELHAAYPSAKVILTHRSTDSWVDSFSSTILQLISRPLEDAPEPMRPWLAMATAVISRTGFPPGLDKAALARAFETHIEAVRRTIPASALLVYQVKDGWEPLCRFLGVQIPDTPFPRSNDRAEFWDKVAAAG
jgi:hypothetical protein